MGFFFLFVWGFVWGFFVCMFVCLFVCLFVCNINQLKVVSGDSAYISLSPPFMEYMDALQSWRGNRCNY